jgi:hypothetical protein
MMRQFRVVRIVIWMSRLKITFVILPNAITGQGARSRHVDNRVTLGKADSRASPKW